MPRDYIRERRDDFDSIMTHLREEMQGIRTGRANPAVVEGVMVEAYGTMQALVSLASISAPDPRSIVIEPWDKSILKAIEKGIIEANIGLNPVVTGEMVRVPLPALTEETRMKMVKLLNEKLEAARINVRRIRDEIRQEVTEGMKEGEITEDEKYRLHEDLDKTAAHWNERIKALGEDKEKEITTI